MDLSFYKPPMYNSVPLEVFLDNPSDEDLLLWVQEVIPAVAHFFELLTENKTESLRLAQILVPDFTKDWMRGTKDHYLASLYGQASKKYIEYEFGVYTVELEEKKKTEIEIAIIIAETTRSILYEAKANRN